MTTYFYYGTILFLVVLHALVDAEEIKAHKTINHNQEFIFFSITSLLTIYLFYEKELMPLIQWLFFCGITIVFLRVGFYDFFLNLFRGKSIWYTSQNADGNYKGTKESLYDDLLHKFGINANTIRVSGVIASIIWLFII